MLQGVVALLVVSAFLSVPTFAQTYQPDHNARVACSAYKKAQAADRAAYEALKKFTVGQIDGRTLYRLREKAWRAKQVADAARAKLPPTAKGYWQWCLGLKAAPLPFGQRRTQGGNQQPAPTTGKGDGSLAEAGSFQPTKDEVDLCKTQKRWDRLVKKYKNAPKAKIPFGDALIMRVMPEAVKAFAKKYPNRASDMWDWCYGRKKKSATAQSGTGAPVPDSKKVVITVYMPQTPALRKWQKRIFGPAFPKFRTARITGHVSWRARTLTGVASQQTIKAVLWHNGKPVRHVTLKTSAYGNFVINLPVNKAGKGAREFRVNISRTVRESVLAQIPKANTSSGKTNTGQKVPGLPRIKIDKAGERIFNTLSKNKAFFDDLVHNAWWGTGTPNMDQWVKNDRAGRSYANALKLLGDLGLSQIKGPGEFQNLNTLSKRLTGKNLPGVKKNDKKGYNAMKSSAKNFRNWIKQRNDVIR